MSSCCERKGGVTGLVIFIVVVLGLVGVYFGNRWFNEKYYIRLFDGENIRYLDVPPYGERITDAELELIGVCDLNIGTSKEQSNDFLENACNRYGFLWVAEEDSIRIELRRNYLIKGDYQGNQLKLRWTPILPEKLKARAETLIKQGK